MAFGGNNSWSLFEEFCSLIKEDDGVWHATMIEVVDYIAAIRRMKCSADGSVLLNPSAISVWATVNGNPVEIGAGRTLHVTSR
jgi:hypothetical protein